jgi:arginine exporter protein ArgO
MLDVAVSGALTGLAIAVPVGAVGALLVALASRAGWRVGAAAALGVASVDGVYAAVAVLAGAAVSAALVPIAGALEVAAGLVLLGVAALLALHALRPERPGAAAAQQARREPGPRAAYLLFVGMTALNPTTLVYFAAVVLGNRDLVDGATEGAVFVAAALVASAVWQLVLATSGALLGQALSGPRGRRLSGLVAAVTVAGLALHTMLG